jgi:hypothetical protein
MTSASCVIRCYLLVVSSPQSYEFEDGNQDYGGARPLDRCQPLAKKQEGKGHAEYGNHVEVGTRYRRRNGPERCDVKPVGGGVIEKAGQGRNRREVERNISYIRRTAV